MMKQTAVFCQKMVLMSTLLLGLYIGQYFAKDAAFCVDLDGKSTCHSTDRNPYRFYGTKTSYHIVVSNPGDKQFDTGNCSPVLFYLLSRHATRYPDGEQIEEMQTLMPDLKQRIISASEEGKSKICKEDIQQLRNWQLRMVPEDDNRISETGRQEAIGLAQRYKKRFPSILGQNYNPQQFKFEYTSRERTHTTAQSFAEGLFGKLRARYVQGSINDKVLQFHSECKKLRKKCNSTSDNLDEIRKFEDGPIMQGMVSSITRRLGFNVSIDEIEMMYRACVFGYALGDSDIWCSVFSRDDLRVMEYDADIDDYYKDGYGNKLNYEQACPVVRYILDTLNSSVGQGDLKAVLQFSHAGALKKVYTRFGLFKDETPLTPDMCSNQNRKWRSSLILPFNSNIAFVLLNCSGEYKIAAYHNEEPVIVGGCQNFFCPVDEFYRTYKSIGESCDINSMCCSCCLY